MNGTRQFQIRLDGVGVALYDGTDAADALRRYYVDLARTRPPDFRLAVDVDATADRATARVNGYRLEAVAVSDPATAGS